MIKILINTKNLVSIKEANQSFLETEIFDFDSDFVSDSVSNDEVKELAQSIINRNIVAFKELAK